MVQDQEVGAAGITETSPGYVSLGQPWVYVEGLTKVGGATAGTHGGVSWKWRPDTMAVWIKRTGSHATQEDYHLLYYSWTGTAKGDKYRGKDGSCTEVSWTNEESDIRQDANGNECGTIQAAKQVSEGWIHERASYGSWTQMKVPIYYVDNTVPEMMNIIFSASNYPNFRSNSGLYAGNSLYIDDVQLIYSSKIQQLFINGVEWRAFDPNSTEEQVYVLGEKIHTIPAIKAYRGAGELTNTRNKTTTYLGRQLSGDEITIVPGVIDETPTTITVRAEDGSSETTYRILFMHEASSNAYLNGIQVNGKEVDNFNPFITSYTALVDYGFAGAPQITVSKQEDKQTVSFTPPTGINDVTVITVTAADRTTKQTYTLQYKEAPLADNTLANILINGTPLPGFNPTQATYKDVKLPLGTTQMPEIVPVPKYDGQTIVTTAPEQIDGGTYLIAVSTPGNPTPKVYKLTFKLAPSDNCYLQGLRVGGESVDNFAPTTYTYYKVLPLGTTELPEITYDQGDAYQTVDVVPAGLDGTTRITVTAGDGVTKMVYKIVFSTLKSDVSTLNGILLNGQPLEVFDPATTSYTIRLTEAELPTIEAIPGDEYEKISIIKGGLNAVTRITVSAGNGAVTVYQLTFRVEQSTNSTLQMIRVGSTDLPGFDSEVLEYTCELPVGTTELPLIEAVPNDEHQTIITRSGGVNGDYKIIVRPQSGASRTYTIHFVVPQSSNTALKMIYLDGVPLANFDADTLAYIDTLEVSTLPTVTWEAESDQVVTARLDGQVQTLRVKAPSGAIRTYTITFVVRKSENAFLKMIYLGGDSLPDFEPTRLNYEHIVISGTVCPPITVDKGEGQQVTIMAPYAAGTAYIVVRVGENDHNTYVLELVDTTTTPLQPVEPEPEYIKSADATLQAVLVNGTPLAEFTPSQHDYTLSLPAGSAMPEVRFVQHIDKQTLIAGPGEYGLFTCIVLAEDGTTATYQLRVTVELSDDAYLKNLSLEGIELAFVPETMCYQATIDKGQTLPEVHYEAKWGQTVLVYAVNDSTQHVMVTAQSGKTNTYIITYTRTMSSNALLKDIWVDGAGLPDFDPHQFAYTYTLPWRTPVVPNVNAWGQVSGQTITTCFSRPNGVTTIHVLAEDGVTTADYTIAFSTKQSDNTALLDLYLESDYGVELNFDADQTSYVVELPYEAVMSPTILFEKAEPEQEVKQVLRPMEQVNEITVKAENGDTRTYRITFHRVALPEQANILRSIFVAETGQAIPMQDTLQRTFDVQLPYDASSMTLSYIKNFSGQTVFVQPGGIYAPTVLTVHSPLVGVPDEVYTVRPVRTLLNPASLTGLTVDGVSVPNFDPDQLTYIVNRTNVSAFPQIIPRYDAATCRCVTRLSARQWSADITAGEYKRTYTIYWHYANDTIPNGEFTAWTQTAKTSSLKPMGWNATNDYVGDYNADQYIKQYNNSVVELTNKAHSSLDWLWNSYKCAPAMLNLASMSASHAVWGGSRGTVSGTIPFRNTPDGATISYQLETLDEKKAGALFRFLFQDENSQTLTFDHIQPAEQSGFETKTVAFNLDGKGIQGYDIVIDAASAALNEGKGAQDAHLLVDYVRFVYNNRLHSVFVNGQEATISGNDITVTLEQSEDADIPVCTFVGQVSDQAQRVVWQAPVVEGDYSVRKGTVTNYGEDGNASVYTLTVRRLLDTNAALRGMRVGSANLPGFSAAKTDYTYLLAKGTRVLPDVTPLAGNLLQRINVSYADSVLTIVVTAENGTAQTYTLRFVPEPVSDAYLANLRAEQFSFHPEQTEYTVVADRMPDFIPVRKSDGQQVTAEQGRIVVTAEDGSKRQYIVSLQTPPSATTGQLTELELDGNILTDFLPTTYRYEKTRPSWMSFVRKDDADSVVYTQYPDSLTWQVIGGAAEHTYVLTSPNEQSSSDELKGISVNGVLLDNFLSTIRDYTLPTDSAVQLSVQGTNAHQQIAVTRLDNTYTITVTAADGKVGTPYTLTIVPEEGTDARLREIRLDGTALATFVPDQYTYTVTLPAGDYKGYEPLLPAIDFVPVDSHAQVEVIAGGLNEVTNLLVTSRDGTQHREYALTFVAEPSHCADLSAIIVNGFAVENFDPARSFYSVMTQSEQVEISYRSLDKFLSVQVIRNGNEYILHTTAQDGVTTRDYQVSVYTQALSTDATLSMLWLDGKEMSAFRTDLNQNLYFHPLLNSYTINLPANITELPEVVATTKMEGQTLSMRQEKTTVLIDVTAADGVTTNTYILHFVGIQSPNSLLKAIYLDGDEWTAFRPQDTYYVLPTSSKQLPDIEPLTEQGQKVTMTSDTDPATNDTQVTITVTSEDELHTTRYVLHFRYTPSDADTLLMLYEDGEPMATFRPQCFRYDLQLPNTASFPAVQWELASSSQTVTVDTLLATGTCWMAQYKVTAESGRSNTYTVTYTVTQSDVDTLQMMYIGGDSLPDFSGTVLDYVYTLPVGTTERPQVHYTAGDDYQSVVLTEQAPAYDDHSLGTVVLTVTAQNGAQRVYTVHFPVAYSESTELETIYCNGIAVPNFDGQVLDYAIQLPYGNDQLPAVSYTKHEPSQMVDIVVLNTTTITLQVTAEDKLHTATYTLTFLPGKSSNALLQGIYFNDTLMADFLPESFFYEYTVNELIDLPLVSYQLAEPNQQVSADTAYVYTADGRVRDITVTLNVTAEDGSHKPYEILFHIKANTPLRPEDSDNAFLLSLHLRGALLSQQMGFDSDFAPERLDYRIVYPVGSDPDAFFTAEDVTCVAQDSLAQVISPLNLEVLRKVKDTLDTDVPVATCIHITVQAPNGKRLTYNIYQTLLLDSLNHVTSLFVEDFKGVAREIYDFDRDIFYYEYTLSDTRHSAPAFGLEFDNTDSRFACVKFERDNESRVVDADDHTNYAAIDSEDDPTYHISYYAEDGTKYMYKIKFRRSDIQRALKPMAGDVLVQHIPGSNQIAVASLRANVVFSLYDTRGYMVATCELEESNPNSFNTVTDGYGQIYFGHVTDFSSCKIFTLQPNTVYFWAFTENGKQKIKSGKLVITR